MDLNEIKSASMQKLNDNLVVVFIGDDRIVFAFGTNVGYIRNDNILIMPAEFYTGGKKSTLFINQYIDVLKKVYNLAGATTEEIINQAVSMQRQLETFADLIKKEKDADKAKAILSESEVLAANLGTQNAQELIMSIRNKTAAIISKGKEAAPVVVPPAPVIEPPVIEPPVLTNPPPPVVDPKPREVTPKKKRGPKKSRKKSKGKKAAGKKKGKASGKKAAKKAKKSKRKK